MKSNLPNTAMPTRTSAFTLIEVLVTVLILAIGFLGLAGLQLTALRQNTSAFERSQATMLAYDIIDRMRANKAAVTAGSYTTAWATAPTSRDCRGTTADCTSSQMAAYDLNQWKCSLGKWNAETICTTLNIQGRLAEGDGTIAVNGDIVSVTIRWAEKREKAVAADQLTTISVSTAI